ncbi:MAG: phosphoribosylformylglycinamidine cyclo-ligase [Elusimicrobia bacterium]|nr:phosphoribosylformylglycinamidine cyclo-ligase [Elusimicrobiota bacterium]
MGSSTYSRAGVHLAQARRWVRGLKRWVPRVGFFAGSYPFRGRGPGFLVASADGVGTKLQVAFLADIHESVGVDVVAMNVNDLLCLGARPLFFMDYLACGKLELERMRRVLKGVARGCRLAGIELLGGETAEMPGFYRPGEYDLAGFAVGWASSNDLLRGSRARAGDALVGLPSSGLHSNGFSLVRKVFNRPELRRLARKLLVPTRIYVQELLPLLQSGRYVLRRAVHGVAHITGGSFPEKLARIVPQGLCAVLRKGSWRVPEIFGIIQSRGRIPEEEMYRVFNMGIGMILAVSAGFVGEVLRRLPEARIVGEVVRGTRRVEIIG